MNDSEHKQALPSGFRLQNYRVVDVLGVGGFGVTYLGEHSTLGHRVAIKEYLPNEFAIRDGSTVHPKSQSDREDFEWGLTRFLDEAKTLARFEHRNLVRVRDYFEANNTAYIVMDYEDGESLDRLLDRHGTLSEAQLRRVLLPIINGLRQVHAEGFLHRDIKPSNIYVRRADETPVLLDFGAARQALGRKSKSMTAVASVGYSPPEQYESDGDQGPWTDIYALSALCYRAITGQAPIEAPRRQSRLARGQPDPLPRLAETVLENYSKSFLQEVDLGLRVIETERPQSLDEWVSCFNVDSEPVGKNNAEIENVIQSQDKPARLTETNRDKAWAIGAVMAVVAIVALAVWSYIPKENPVVDVVVNSQPEETFADALASGGKGPDMVVIPAGNFLMGCLSNDDDCYDFGIPVHYVRIPQYFALSMQETTRGEFSRFVEATGYSTGNSCYIQESVQLEDRSGSGWHNPGFRQTERDPVVCVNWQDARAYVAWLSQETGKTYRLPSESEWEFSARAGSVTKYTFGNDKSRLCRYGNGADASTVFSWRNASCSDGVGEQTAPVGSYEVNAFGLYDMHGNVYEWVQDCWNDSYNGAPRGGEVWSSGDCAKRVLRGGSWFSGPRSLRAAGRIRSPTGARVNFIGFRVARTLTP